MLTGSNAAWCHPILHQRMVKNRRERGARIVVIDPRRTATAEDADLVLQIAPGTDGVLFSGLLAHLAAQEALDRDFIRDCTSGFAERACPRPADRARSRDGRRDLRDRARGRGHLLRLVSRYGEGGHPLFARA